MIPTDTERVDGALTDENLATALRRLREAGYVVFESLLPGGLTRELRGAFQDIHEQEFRDREADASWNRRGGRGARFEHPFMDPLLLENPIAMQDGGGHGRRYVGHAAVSHEHVVPRSA